MASMNSLTVRVAKRRQSKSTAGNGGATSVHTRRPIKEAPDFAALFCDTKLGRLMIKLARKKPSFEEFLRMMLNIKELRLSEEDTHFDMVIDCATNAINKAYQLRLFQEREFKVNVVGAIHRCLTVVDMKINSGSSFCSKAFALLTLGHIGWLIREAKGVVGDVLRREFISGQYLETCVDVIIDCLTDEESDWLCGWNGTLFVGGFEALLTKGGEHIMLSDLRTIQKRYLERATVSKSEMIQAKVIKSKSGRSKDLSNFKRIVRNTRWRRSDRCNLFGHVCGR